VIAEPTRILHGLSRIRSSTSEHMKCFRHFLPSPRVRFPVPTRTSVQSKGFCDIDLSLRKRRVAGFSKHSCKPRRTMAILRKLEIANKLRDVDAVRLPMPTSVAIEAIQVRTTQIQGRLWPQTISQRVRPCLIVACQLPAYHVATPPRYLQTVTILLIFSPPTPQATTPN
jgi:hypothetical protein